MKKQQNTERPERFEKSRCDSIVVFLKTQADLGGVVNWTGGDDQLVLDYVPRS